MFFMGLCNLGYVLPQKVWAMSCPTSENVAQVMSYLRKGDPGHVLPQKVWPRSCPTSESVGRVMSYLKKCGPRHVLPKKVWSSILGLLKDAQCRMSWLSL